MTEQLSMHAPIGQGADISLKQEQSGFLPKEFLIGDVRNRFLMTLRYLICKLTSSE